MSKINNSVHNYFKEFLPSMKIDSIKRKNGDFKFAEELKTFILNDHFRDQDKLWDFFEDSSDIFATLLYESMTNMVENVSDVDFCSIAELKNVAMMLGITELNLFNLPVPFAISSLIDTYSVNQEYVLYGEHSLADMNTLFGTDKLTEDIKDQYYDSLVDTSFKEVLLNKLYQPSSKIGSEYIAFIALIIPTSVLENAADYQYITNIRDGIIPRGTDAELYLMLNDGVILNTASKFLRNYCIKLLIFRETLKSTVQRNAIVGTEKIIEKMLSEYIINNYSNIAELGFYVPVKTESDIIAEGASSDPFRSWTRFLKNLSDLSSSLNVEIVEYYDDTEYLNILPDEIPLVVNSVPDLGWYSEPYLNVSGGLEYLDPVQIVTGYHDETSVNPIRNNGNTRFWEAATSDENTDSILKMFKRLGAISEDDDATVLRQYLDKVYDISTPGFWNTLEPTNYASTGVLQNMQDKYIGLEDEGAVNPHANNKAQDYPTIAPIPFLWNLVEKTYSTFPQKIQYTIDSNIATGTNIGNIVDLDEDKGALYSPNATDIKGMIIDSWRSYAKEYFSYETYYESESNLDNTNVENKNAQIDGSFNMLALGDLLEIYNDSGYTGDISDVSGVLSALAPYYYNLG